MRARRTIAVAAATVLCAGWLTGISVPAAQAQAFEQYSGEETFQRFCASCHGESGRGDGPVAAGLAITVPDLTLLAQRHGNEFPESAMRKIIDGREIVIVHGTRYMPVWGYEFWLEEGADENAQRNVETIVDNLIDYLETLQR